MPQKPLKPIYELKGERAFPTELQIVIMLDGCEGHDETSRKKLFLSVREQQSF